VRETRGPLCLPRDTLRARLSAPRVLRDTRLLPSDAPGALSGRLGVRGNRLRRAREEKWTRRGAQRVTTASLFGPRVARDASCDTQVMPRGKQVLPRGTRATPRGTRAIPRGTQVTPRDTQVSRREEKWTCPVSRALFSHAPSGIPESFRDLRNGVGSLCDAQLPGIAARERRRCAIEEGEEPQPTLPLPANSWPGRIGLHTIFLS
jgi:hypothetical protein